MLAGPCRYPSPQSTPQPPANMSCPQPPHSPPGATTASRRPKLSLQTASVPRTFGKSNTALSIPLATDPTTSPTARNTFNNAYSVPSLPSPSSSSSSSSSHTAMVVSAQSAGHVYQLPRGLKSILLNSPVSPSSSTNKRRRLCSLESGPSSPTTTRRACLLPSPRKKGKVKKKVSYRQPLEEEIHTVHFIARHSDLDDDDDDHDHVLLLQDDSSNNTNAANIIDRNGGPEQHDRNSPSSSPASSSSSSSDETSDSELSSSNTSTSTISDIDSSPPPTTATVSSRPPGPPPMGTIYTYERKKRRQLEDGPDVTLLHRLCDDEDTPHTPRQRSSKRRCEWRWTLGPVNANGVSSHQSTNHDDDDDDDCGVGRDNNDQKNEQQQQQVSRSSSIF